MTNPRPPRSTEYAVIEATRKTYDRRAKGNRYQLSAVDVIIAGEGRGVLISCTCKAHQGTSGLALHVSFLTAETFDPKLIHGNVYMAHSNALARQAAQRGGLNTWAA